MNQSVVTNSGGNAPFGSVERKIARRYLGAKKKDGGVAAIAWISFTCIMLAIMAMIIIMSIMNGFRDTVLELTLGSEGHVYVNLQSWDVEPAKIAQMERDLMAMPEVETAFEFSDEGAGLAANETLQASRVMGITAENLNKFKLVSDNIKEGSLMGFGQGRGSDHQIAIGRVLANSSGLQVGDRVRIMTPRTRNTPQGRMPVMKVYTIGAIFQTGLLKTDNVRIFMELDQAQLLFNSGRKNGTLQLRLYDPDDVDKVRGKVARMLDGQATISTWKDIFKDEALALRTEQIAMRFIFVIVVIISTFPILSAMLMLVKNKARDIAILRTIGATQSSILRIFFIAGIIIGICGTIAGLVLGLLFCWQVDAVQSLIEAITGQPLFPEGAYGIDGRIPVKVVWSEVISVAMCGFVISALATFIPAYGASKTDPVEALRYE